MWHQWFNCHFTKLREYFLCAKKTQRKNDFIQKFVSSASPYSTILESSTYVNNVCCSVSAAPYEDTLFTLFTLWSECKQHFRVHTLHTLFTYVMTWGWVINDRIFIFGWTIPLSILQSQGNRLDYIIQGVSWERVFHAETFGAIWFSNWCTFHTASWVM